MRSFFTAIATGVLFLRLVSCASADLIVDFVTPPGPVEFVPGVGTITTSFDIRISNAGDTAEGIASYSFFLDIGPVGAVLPTGISFDSPAATYIAGVGVPPLIGAGNPGTIELNPAAGDLGLGQVQFFNGTINPGESFPMLTVNLVVDRALANSGSIDLFLNPDGENAIVKLGPSGETVAVDFTVTRGSLELRAIPEPTAASLLCMMACYLCTFLRRKNNPLTAAASLRA